MAPTKIKISMLFFTIAAAFQIGGVTLTYLYPGFSAYDWSTELMQWGFLISGILVLLMQGGLVFSIFVIGDYGGKDVYLTLIVILFIVNCTYNPVNASHDILIDVIYNLSYLSSVGAYILLRAKECREYFDK